MIPPNERNFGQNTSSETVIKTGAFYAVLAYTGAASDLLETLGQIPSLEVVSHRIIWSIFLTGLFVHQRQAEFNKSFAL